MIRRTINIEGYWKVIVYYNVNYNFFHFIEKDLIKIGCNENQIDSIYNNMAHNYAKGVTISSINYYTSVVLFNKHKTKDDYINTIIHEAEHIKQSILYVYKVEDYGEPPAYLMGYLAMKLLELKLIKSTK